MLARAASGSRPGPSPDPGLRDRSGPAQDPRETEEEALTASQRSPQRPVVGVIPAAGHANRLGSPEKSKELLPVYRRSGRPATDPISPVCLCLLDAMRGAGIRCAHVVIRPGKEDIRHRLGDGAALGMRIEHHYIEASRGPADTIDHVFSSVRDATVAVGFPDVLFEPLDLFASLLARLDSTGADIVLGLFPTEGGGLDRVHLDEKQRVISIEFDPPSGGGYDTWCVAVWTPHVTELLHRFAADPAVEERGEMILGRMLEAALEEGLRIEAVRPPGAWFIDVGSPAGLFRARARLAAVTGLALQLGSLPGTDPHEPAWSNPGEPQEL